MKVLSSVTCFIWCIAILTGQGLDTFESGNTAYDNKEYPQAILLYNSLVEAGKASPELYHNLGNAYYHVDSLGNAMLSYERGLALEPNHTELINDRDFLKGVIESDIFEVPAFLPVRIWRSFCRMLPPNVWVAFQILGLLGIVAYLFLFWLRPKSLHPSWLSILKWVSGILILISTLVLLSVWYQQQSNQAAIVMSETGLFTGPDERSEEVAPIKAGEKVQVLELFEDWARVQLLNLEEGFVKVGDLEEI